MTTKYFSTYETRALDIICLKFVAGIHFLKAFSTQDVTESYLLLCASPKAQYQETPPLKMIPRHPDFDGSIRSYMNRLYNEDNNNNSHCPNLAAS